MSYITFLTCFILGELIKLLFSSMDKKWIPFIVGGFGMIFCPLICWELTPATVAQGLIAGFASSGGYDAIKVMAKQHKSLN